MLCLVGLLMAFGFFSQNVTQAQCTPGATTLCIPDGTQTGLPDPSDPNNAVFNVLKKVLNWMLSILGIIGVISFAVSGFMYLTAYGNEKQIENAKKTIAYSIIGIVVALTGLVVVQTIAFLLA